MKSVRRRDMSETRPRTIYAWKSAERTSQNEKTTRVYLMNMERTKGVQLLGGRRREWYVRVQRRGLCWHLNTTARRERFGGSNFSWDMVSWDIGHPQTSWLHLAFMCALRGYCWRICRKLNAFWCVICVCLAQWRAFTNTIMGLWMNYGSNYSNHVVNNLIIYNLSTTSPTQYYLK